MTPVELLTVSLFSHQCPSSRRSTTWALRWWSRATPWYRPGLIWPSWFTLWTTAAQTRSDCHTVSEHLPLPPLLLLPSLLTHGNTSVSLIKQTNPLWLRAKTPPPPQRSLPFTERCVCVGGALLELSHCVHHWIFFFLPLLSGSPLGHIVCGAINKTTVLHSGEGGVLH